MKNKNLVVGTGISGATIANLLANKGENVVIIDKRLHIAGNCYDYKDETGITVHKYGSHIFHTNNIKIWEFLNKFSDFNAYQHKVIVNIDNKIQTNLPYNLNSLYDTFDNNLAKNLEKKLIDTYGKNKKIPINKLLETKDDNLSILANFVYQNIFLNYTKKHWGKNAILDENLYTRVPIITNKNNNYFDDKYQGIPKFGYAELVKNMLNHPNIEIKLGTRFNLNKECNDYKKIFYTGSIDELFDFKYGKLPYRSVEFELEKIDKEYYQNNSVVNFPNTYNYTRIHEYKYYLNENSNSTIIAKEYPKQYELNKNEPHYPINNKNTTILYKKYKKDVSKINNLYVLGRLGEYKYLNMDEAILSAFKVFENLKY